MPKQRVDLDKLVHRNPCSESWEAMPGDDWTRHCDKCGQNVYNLSALTRAEAERLLRERGPAVCTAFYRRPDGTLLTQQCPSSVRRSWARFAAAFAGLGFALPAWAQYGMQCPESSAEIKQKAGKGQYASVELVVADLSGAVIPGVRVSLRKGESVQQFTSNERGQVTLVEVEPGEYELAAESEGFRSLKKSDLKLEAATRYEIKVELQIGSVGGNAMAPERKQESQRASLRGLLSRLWT